MESSVALFAKSKKNALILEKRPQLSPSLVRIFRSKSSFKSIYKKKLKNFCLGGIFSLRFLQKVYQSNLIPQNLPCPEKYLIAHLHLFLSESKSSFITWSASSLIMIYMLKLFECITCSSSLSLNKIRLFAIVNWLFHVSIFLRLFMMSFQYGLILKRYCLTDVLFLSPVLLYSI